MATGAKAEGEGLKAEVQRGKGEGQRVQKGEGTLNCEIRCLSRLFGS